MNEFERIVDAYEKIDLTVKRTALATVVKLYGSSYRRPGARMLMTEDGHWWGAISGGCLEGDALRKARKAILDGKPTLVTYDTMNDESAMNLGVGLGCNGIIDVLIEPLAQDGTADAISMLKTTQSFKESAVIATVFRKEEGLEIPIGSRFLLLPDGKVEDNIAHTRLSPLIAQDVQNILHSRKSENKVYQLAEGEVEVFLEAVQPSIQLYVFGGGYDAVPVTNIAKNMGWKVIVADDCPAHLSPKRFPQAESTLCIPRDKVAETIHITNYTVAVLMSHNYKFDLAVLKQLLKTDIKYIGVLGPKKRFRKMQDELAEEGIYLTENDLLRIHSPIGLDLGAETPEEIALSIIAEIQAKTQGKNGSFLKDKKGYIHDRKQDVEEFDNYRICEIP
jgi:xanthine/CO dehydrogenase XdhC/CoxF family maturation factor